MMRTVSYTVGMLTKAESILLWSSNLWGLGSGMLGPLYAVYAQDIGGDILGLGWIYACYLAVMGMGVILVGRYADSGKSMHAKLLVAGAILGTAATYGYVFVTSIWGLLFVQVMIGVATALREPSWYALYDHFSGDGSHDGYIWGLSSGLWYLFQGLALLVGAYIASEHSFTALFLVMGTMLLISTLYHARILQYRVQ